MNLALCQVLVLNMYNIDNFLDNSASICIKFPMLLIFKTKYGKYIKKQEFHTLLKGQNLMILTLLTKKHFVGLIFIWSTKRLETGSCAKGDALQAGRSWSSPLYEKLWTFLTQIYLQASRHEFHRWGRRRRMGRPMIWLWTNAKTYG